VTNALTPNFNKLEGAPIDFSSNEWINWILSYGPIIMPGDVVFYKSQYDYKHLGEWGHAALVVGWGTETYYREKGKKMGSYDFYSRFECAKNNDPILSWARRPLVVERSGSLEYGTARSIDDTASDIVQISIIHVTH
jgi:hypothetical protein